MSISCLVCLESFVENNQDVVSVKCGHIFHLSCLEDWRNSKQELSNKCPLCRVTYNKRSLKKLFLGVADSESEIKFKNDLQKLKAEKSREELEKQKYMNELDKVKMALGIKDEQYQLIDSVNNEFIQTNQKLKEQNEELLAEKNRILEQMESLKRKLPAQPQQTQSLVDLTADIEDDDEVQFVSATRGEPTITGVVEINDDDDDDDVQIIADCANAQEMTHPTDTPTDTNHDEIGHRIAPIETVNDESTDITVKPEILPVSVILEEQECEQPTEDVHLTFGEIPRKREHSSLDESEPTFKKPCPSNDSDYSFIKDFILSQI